MQYIAAMKVFDRAPITGTRKTADGYLVTEARISASNIQAYLGAEVGRPDLASVRIFRPESEVFSKDAMASACHKPLTIGHPPMVDAATWKTTAIGWTSGDVARDGEYLKISMLLADADAIRLVESGTRSLSCGYECLLDWTPGVTPDGKSYDARQTAIRLNHVGLVQEPRCPGARIGDAQTQGTPMLHGAQAFADSAAGRSAIAYEENVARLNRREPRSAAELFRDHQAGQERVAGMLADTAAAMPAAREAADAARAEMIAKQNERYYG